MHMENNLGVLLLVSYFHFLYLFSLTLFVPEV